MKYMALIVLPFLVPMLAATSLAGVYVTNPLTGTTVGSPVNYTASATTGCSKGVASMGVYVDNNLVYVANGEALFNIQCADTVLEHRDAERTADGDAAASESTTTQE